MASKTSRKTRPITTGFTLGNWDNTFDRIADARNTHRPKAKKVMGDYPLVEHYSFNIHGIRSGKPTVKPLARLDLPRSKAAVERACAEWAKANPGKPFTLVYEGWFDGSKCLPRYNSPTQKDDRIERVVVFSLTIYTHTGDQTPVTPSDAEAAEAAVVAALEAQR